MLKRTIVKHDKEAIQVMTDFVEGKMPIKDFKYRYDNDPLIKKNFGIYPNRPHKHEIGLDYIPYMDTLDISKRSGALNLHGFFKEFLEINKYRHTPTETYLERFTFLLKIQPDWIDITDEAFLEERIISKAPADLSEDRKIKWCKERIKELFKYDSKPPRWVQEAEWPVVDGKPLVFREQSKEKDGDERVCFHFYDPDTKRETVVIQMY